jgi:metallo-beta-lactamase class B
MSISYSLLKGGSGLWFFILSFLPLSMLAQQPPSRDEMAKDPVLFLKVARKALAWDEPAEPAKIASNLYFVGMKGLASYLITTPEGHILVYTGMPGSGPMIEASIRKLGFNPQDIRYILAAHAHCDHAGGHAYLQKLSGAKVVSLAEEKDLFENGGKTDFHYGAFTQYAFDPVKVDLVIRDGDQISLGPIKMMAMHTPGHTKGGNTWVTQIIDGGKALTVVFPDGTSINPGYRLVNNPSYPGIEQDLRNTLHKLEMLKPDIWLSSHTDFFNFEAKRKRAAMEGIKAWIDPEGYRLRIAGERANLENLVNQEKGAVKPNN